MNRARPKPAPIRRLLTPATCGPSGIGSTARWRYGIKKMSRTGDYGIDPLPKRHLKYFVCAETKVRSRRPHFGRLEAVSQLL